MTDEFRRELRGFGPLGLSAAAAILLAGNVTAGRLVVFPLGAGLVLVWAWIPRTPWREIG